MKEIAVLFCYIITGIITLFAICNIETFVDVLLFVFFEVPVILIIHALMGGFFSLFFKDDSNG